MTVTASRLEHIGCHCCCWRWWLCASWKKHSLPQKCKGYCNALDYNYSRSGNWKEVRRKMAAIAAAPTNCGDSRLHKITRERAHHVNVVGFATFVVILWCICMWRNVCKCTCLRPLTINPVGIVEIGSKKKQFNNVHSLKSLAVRTQGHPTHYLYLQRSHMFYCYINSTFAYRKATKYCRYKSIAFTDFPIFVTKYIFRQPARKYACVCMCKRIRFHIFMNLYVYLRRNVLSHY